MNQINNQLIIIDHLEYYNENKYSKESLSELRKLIKESDVKILVNGKKIKYDN